MDKKKSNGAVPTSVQLTKEERLEVQLLNLQRDNVQLQATRELDNIGKQVATLVGTINARLGSGVDISKYNIDFKTGLATLIEQAEPDVTDQKILPGLPSPEVIPS